jgi:hypothetical protein
MIYVWTSEVAWIKLAVNKSYCDKIALGEITLVNVQDSNSLKLTSFTVSDVIVNQGCIQTLYGLNCFFKRDFYDG